tara:strand:- start:445 stop:771 length:327 start_codon:yes stop_codon:yes gene_type:complete
MGVINSGNPGLSSATSTFVTTGKVQNVTIALANTEQSHAFPAYTKAIQVKARGNGKILMSFDSGTSGTVYQTIWPGAVYTQENIGSATTTIYFQSPNAGLILELTSWV